MKHYDFETRGVCSRLISFDLEDGKVYNVSFLYGCDGNLRAIGKLVEGMPAAQLVSVLKGNTCGHKKTSCADQLACAVEAAMAENA